jgi:hypothetical protein
MIKSIPRSLSTQFPAVDNQFKMQMNRTFKLSVPPSLSSVSRWRYLFSVLYMLMTCARADSPPSAFLHFTCISDAQYLSLDYKTVPDEMIQSDPKAITTALRKNGYRDPDGLVFECKLPQSTYVISSSQNTEGDPGDCGARVSLRYNQEQWIEDVAFGGACDNRAYLTSIDIWDGSGITTPGWMNLCFKRNSDGEERSFCTDYQPHPAQKLTLPPITQQEIEAFFKARTNATPRGTGWSRPAFSLMNFMFERYPCEFPNFNIGQEVAVLAAVGGKATELPFQIDFSGEQASVKEIYVDLPSRPVALVLLGGGDPTVWNVHWTAGTHIVAVAAYGSRRQAVAGLPSQVPVFAPYFGSGHACKFSYWETYRPNFPIPREREEIDSVVKQLFGRLPDSFISAHREQASLGVTPSSRAAFTQSADVSVASFKNQTPRPSPDQLLDVALKQGQLRLATQKDAQDWRAAFAEAAGSGQKVRPVAKDWSPILYRAYVVLLPFTFPPDLFGAHLATFFIPKGVPLPRGERGHSVVLDFNTLKCFGPQESMCGYY